MGRTLQYLHQALPFTGEIAERIPSGCHVEKAVYPKLGS